MDAPAPAPAPTRLPDTLVATPLFAAADTPARRSLRAWCAGRRGVLEIWHSSCPHCPPAAERLLARARTHPDELHVTLALSRGDGDRARSAALFADRLGGNLLHLFLEAEDIADCKASLNFHTVPHVRGFDEAGNLFDLP